MLKPILFLLVFAQCYLSYSSSVNVPKEDTIGYHDQMNVMFKHIGHVRMFDLDRAIRLSEWCFELSEQLSDSVNMGKSLILKGDLLRSVGELKQSKEALVKGIAIVEPLGASKQLMNASYNLGIVYDLSGASKLALRYYEKTSGIAEQINSSRGKALVLGALANFNLIRGNYERSLQYNQEGIAQAASLDDGNLLWSFYYNISSIHYKMHHISKAVESGMQALKTAQKYQDSVAIGKSLIKLGYFYMNYGVSAEDDHLVKSEYYLRMAYRILQSSKNEHWQMISGYNLAELLRRKGEFDSSFVYVERAFQFYQSRNYNSLLALTAKQIAELLIDMNDFETAFHYTEIGIGANQAEDFDSYVGLIGLQQKLHLLLGDSKKSIELGEKTYELASKQKKWDVLLTTSQLLAKAHSQQSNHIEAYDYLDQAMSIKDSVLAAKNSTDLIEVMSKMNYEQEKQQAINQRTQEALIQEQKAQKQRFLQFLGLGLGLSLVVIILVLYKNIERRKKDNMRLQHNNEELRTLRKNEQELRRREKFLLEAVIRSKEQKLATMAVASNEKDRLLMNIKSKVEQIESERESSLGDELNKIRSIISDNQQLENSWKKFKTEFEEVHPRFFEKLKEDFAMLTQYDLKLCAYLKIGINNKEIAQITNVTIWAVKKQLYRLKKKIGLHPDHSIRKMMQNY